MKVGIIGAGDVGTACAQRIVESDIADVVLVDIVKGKAKGRALDLASACSIVGHSRTITGSTDFESISGSDIIVVTCGQTRSPGQSRADLLQANAQIIKDVAKKIAGCCPETIVIMVTNPLDVLTYLTLKITGFAENQIIGMGGTSDCARFNMLVAAELTTNSHYVHSVIIGPHSDKMIILPRLSTVLGIPITDLLPPERIQNIISETKQFGAKIVGLLGKGSAYFGPSAGVFSLVDSIINDRKSILCACSYLDGQYGLKDICTGIPLKIGRMGIEEKIKLKLTAAEKSRFLDAASSVKYLIKELGE